MPEIVYMWIEDQGRMEFDSCQFHLTLIILFYKVLLAIDFMEDKQIGFWEKQVLEYFGKCIL